MCPIIALFETIIFIINNMVKQFFLADKAYTAPVCDLLDAALEENFCVSGNGSITDATEEDWGNF